jgi:tetratricopeptide (TPR) repeat protein
LGLTGSAIPGKCLKLIAVDAAHRVWEDYRVLRYFFELLGGGMGIGGSIAALLFFAFTVWMFVHAIRNGEYIWAAFIFFFSIFSAIMYYFWVYRTTAGSGNPLSGFEIPGAADRKRIKELQGDIHHLDKAHLHMQLADIYYNQGKLDKADESYRAAYERDPNDEDIRAHYGTCLARRDHPQEALPLLESVCAVNSKHDYGYTLMTLAETQAAVGNIDAALTTWRQVLAMYGYPRAHVQFADLLIKRKEYAEARKHLEDVVNDEPYVTKFQRKREAVWFSRAKSALRSLPKT